MKKTLLTALIAAVIVIPIALGGSYFYFKSNSTKKQTADNDAIVQKSSLQKELEKKLKSEGKFLLQLPAPKLTETQTGQSQWISFTTLESHELYLKDPKNPDNYLFLDSQGNLKENGKTIHKMVLHAELLHSAGKKWLFVDNMTLNTDMSNWQLFWASREKREPQVKLESYTAHKMADSFMRTELLSGDWKLTKGSWSLKQRGGGLPTTEEDLQNYNFQRAVNPFSVLGSNHGILSYGDDNWLNAHAEARFYFGTPWHEGYVDNETLPIDRDMMVAQGKTDGWLLAFGWEGKSKSFVLMLGRPKDTGDKQAKVPVIKISTASETEAAPEQEYEWEVLGRFDKNRPAISNWVKIGLRLKHGHIAQAYLDDKLVLESKLTRRLHGSFHILAGAKDIELDDIKAWTLPKNENKWQALYVRSRTFSGKTLKDKADPSQFSEWAQGADTFLNRVENDSDNTFMRTVIMNRIPLLGDFLYETIPENSRVGELPYGIYEIEVFENIGSRSASFDKPEDLKQQLKMQLIYDENGWLTTNAEGAAWAMSKPEATLRLRRSADADNRISILKDGKYQPLTAAVNGPVHLAIKRLLPAGGNQVFPKAEHHQIYSKNLINEFFEEAPVNWSWIEGSFRMDCRWACQNRWNFMACGGTGVPMMVSKKKYSGNQEHEYYMSLRPVFPSDAGDKNFVYTPTIHRKLFRQNGGWYNRRDMNFSFCFDGKNPLSGYAVVFGGDDNRETRLLRKGKIVARTSAYLFTGEGSRQVHWKWWNFHVRKYKNQIQVYLNNELLFDYTDEEPIKGGHTAFWTVRNGFTVSRVSSTAEKIEDNPHVLYVSNDSPSDWQAMLPDSVNISQTDDNLTRVTAVTGAGFKAVRYKLDDEIDLQKTPILEMPIEVDKDSKVNIHIQVDNRAYLIPISAPVNEMKSFLAPQYESGEQFQITTLSESVVKTYRSLQATKEDGRIRINLLEALKQKRHYGAFKLKTITIGNTSNEAYLLAGHGGNQAGSSYLLGNPSFSAADNK